jgi:glucose-specific phosphotransferase system IIA component
MFNLFKQEKTTELYSIVKKGELCKIEEVPDETFSSKMLGDGVAFKYDTDVILSPCDATVVMFYPTKHAIGLETKDDIEILIHIGINTVNLGGDGFEALTQVKDKVRRGQPLLKINREIMEANNINLITSLIITSNNSFKKENIKEINENSIILKFV